MVRILLYFICFRLMDVCFIKSYDVFAHISIVSFCEIMKHFERPMVINH